MWVGRLVMSVWSGEWRWRSSRRPRGYPPRKAIHRRAIHRGLRYPPRVTAIRLRALIRVPAGYYPPPAQEPPRFDAAKWKEGDRVPQGYHVEERVRRGDGDCRGDNSGRSVCDWTLVRFRSRLRNSSGWLAVPALGPWLCVFADPV